MAQYDDTSLMRSLRAGQLEPVYLIYGKDVFLSESCLSRIIEKAVKKGSASFNLRKFDGASLDMPAILAETEGFPLMSDKKCVVVMNPNLEKLSKSDSTLLDRILSDPNPTTVFILYVAAFDLNPAKSARIRKLTEAVDKAGAVVCCNIKTRSELSSIIRKKCQKAGCEMTPQVANALIDRCGRDLGILMTETDKLISWRESGEISRADVETLTRKSLEASIFDLSKAMLQNGRSLAFSILNDLFAQREEPLAVLAALNGAFLDLYRAKAAMLAGKTAEDVCTLFPCRGREFRVRNAFRDVTRYSAFTLRACLRVLADADLEIKSGRTDGRIITEKAVAQILALKEEGA